MVANSINPGAENAANTPGQTPVEIGAQHAEREPMPRNLWTKLYAHRNGQLELILDITTEEGRDKCFAANAVKFPKSSYSRSEIIKSDLTYRRNDNTARESIQSWGDLVAFSISRGIDLSGLTVSDEQKNYSYRLELQGKNLNGGKFDHAVFDGMDLSNTNFFNTSLNFASLKNTTGVKPHFYSAVGQQMDFSGAKYLEPNFTKMVALRATHFNAVYDQATFEETNWNSSRFVGTQFFLKNASNSGFALDLSSSLAAACLFMGMGIEKVSPFIRFNQVAFPGSCFHNLKLYAGPGYMQKADFSPLSLNDPRLTPEEKVYAESFGQWLNSPDAQDGLKVSSETPLPELDTARIYAMFSETSILLYKKDADTQFFSKREVLSRTNFHECALVDLNTLLPEALRIVVPKVQEVPVIQEVVQDTKADFLQVPHVTLDRAKLDEQIDDLKTASISSATSLGMDLQAAFSKAATFVSQWAIAGSGHQSAFSTHLKDLTDRLAAYDIDEQTPVEAPPAPLPEPVVPKKRGFFARAGMAMGLIGDNSLDVIAATVAIDPFKENDEKFARIRQDIGGIQDVVTKAIEKSAEKLTNIEELNTYLNTLHEAMTAYNEGIDNAMPELEEAKGATSAFVKAVLIRRQSLGQSEAMLETLKENVSQLLDVEIEKGAGIQWVQCPVLPTLNTQFTSASGLYDLSRSLRRNDGAYQNDKILSGLYNVSVQKAGADKVGEQVKLSFGTSKKAIVDALQGVVTVLETVETKKAAALEAILQPN
jgi:uncharacterized protein YjbI with pentapeptide repeats